jgi:hypothetical protein
MAISVQKLNNIQRTVIIPFDGDEINVTYKLSAINSKLSDWLDDHGSDRRSILGWLERVLVRWDILGSDGDPIPVTSEAMETYQLPTPLLRMVWAAVNEDASPNALKASFGTGSPSRSGSARNGTL